MQNVTREDLKKLYLPGTATHKGQNGKLLIIGGSHLFHAASLWSLEVASRIVDLVHYSSVPENNVIVEKLKEEFRDGIIVPREEIESYIEEDDCILIGPGMTRDSETETLTNTLIKKYPQKQWVIDAGALQMMDINLIPQNAILTPHHGEFEDLCRRALSSQSKFARGNENFLAPLLAGLGLSNPSSDKIVINDRGSSAVELGKRSAKISSPRALLDQVKLISKKYHCIILLKGQIDIVCNGLTGECREIAGGNAGMTKGGTGDVLAGLIAALACKNDPFLATISGSFINKQAGDELYKSVGPYFNASDLARQIPLTMRKLLL